MRLCEIWTSEHLVDGVTDTARRDKARHDTTVGKVGRESLMYVNRKLIDMYAVAVQFAIDGARHESFRPS